MYLVSKRNFLICRVKNYQVLLGVKIAQSTIKQTLTNRPKLHFMFLLPLQL